jgi:hypothetical protein
MSTCYPPHCQGHGPHHPRFGFHAGPLRRYWSHAALWNDDDNSIRITSRSICALVARQVVRKRQLKGRTFTGYKKSLKVPQNAILEADVTVRDRMNFKSFVYGVLPNHVSDLSTEDATSFNESLAILLGIRTDGHIYFATPEWHNRLSEEVGRIHSTDCSNLFCFIRKTGKILRWLKCHLCGLNVLS